MSQGYRKLHWTEHSKIKMRQYGLSKMKLIKLLYKPERKEKGIAPGTTAVMQSNPVRNSSPHRPFGSASAGGVSNGASKTFRKSPGEIWLMYKDAKDARKIISAWRYPGVSKPGESAGIIAKYSD